MRDVLHSFNRHWDSFLSLTRQELTRVLAAADLGDDDDDKSSVGAAGLKGTRRRARRRTMMKPARSLFSGTDQYPADHDDDLDGDGEEQFYDGGDHADHHDDEDDNDDDDDEDDEDDDGGDSAGDAVVASWRAEVMHALLSLDAPSVRALYRAGLVSRAFAARLLRALARRRVAVAHVDNAKECVVLGKRHCARVRTH
jgi:hypothetical protein